MDAGPANDSACLTRAVLAKTDSLVAIVIAAWAGIALTHANRCGLVHLVLEDGLDTPAQY